MGKSAAERKADQRMRMKASGLVLVQFWVPKGQLAKLVKYATKLNAKRR